MVRFLGFGHCLARLDNLLREGAELHRIIDRIGTHSRSAFADFFNQFIQFAQR